MERDAIIKKAFELGFEYEAKYHGCAQCTIAAIQDALGIRNDFVYKAGSGLAGGGGECIDGSCGGYSGAIMMMSLLFGRERKDLGSEFGRKEKNESSRMASSLHDRFLEKYGSVCCKEIQTKVFGRSFNLRDEKEKEEFNKAGAHDDKDKCCMVVGDGASWATGLILDEIAKRGLSLKDFRHIVCTFR